MVIGIKCLVNLLIIRFFCFIFLFQDQATNIPKDWLVCSTVSNVNDDNL